MNFELPALSLDTLISNAAIEQVLTQVLPAVILLLFLLSLAFVSFFLVPAVSLDWRLGRLLRRLLGPELSGVSDLSPAFQRRGVLQHLWNEFRETLHEERAINAQSGIQEVVGLRATMPAETFFTLDTIVNTEVRAEFFKHLPGIFTGLGIIGTFSGLILGLKHFQVTENPEAVRASLSALMTSVSHAFVVSAGAISLAMFTTGVEKFVLVRLSKKVGRLNQALDERYKSGIGEEYLSRLVSTSEESTSQIKILKDALVQDLRTILTDLADRQIAATTQGNAQLGQTLSSSLGDGLKDPLDKIAVAVGAVSRDQGTAVQALLTDVLSAFSQRLQELFGGQLSGLNQMQQQTIHALQTAVIKLEAMANSVEGAGQRTSQAMAAQLGDVLREVSAHQDTMNREMRGFAQDIRVLVGQSQTESADHLRGLLQGLAQKAESLVGDLSARSQQHVDAMGGQVDVLATSVVEASRQMASAVERLGAITSDSIGRMNSSAETLAIAADDFSRAGQGVSEVLGRSDALAQQLSQSASSVGLASRSLDALLSDYRTVQNGVTQILSTMNEAVGVAKREASMTSDILQRLESSAARLAVAQKAADEYLGQVTEVLAAAHEGFANSVKKTLNTANTEFYTSLSQATSLLREAISELESTLGSVSSPTAAPGR